MLPVNHIIIVITTFDISPPLECSLVPPRLVSLLEQRVLTAQALALGSMVWLSAALLYSLVLSMLVSGGDPRRLQPLALSQDHSTTPQQHGQ